MMEPGQKNAKKMAPPDWREFAFYAAISGLLAVLNASLTVLLVF